jgi:hypothetical protein
VTRAVCFLADALAFAAAVARATAEGFTAAERSLSGLAVPSAVPDSWIADNEEWVWGEGE